MRALIDFIGDALLLFVVLPSIIGLFGASAYFFFLIFTGGL